VHVLPFAAVATLAAAPPSQSEPQRTADRLVANSDVPAVVNG
jgi:hypothetical protein